MGPAGEVFDRALVEVGLARERLYVTNVVKHFKFVERGTRRIHQTPRAPEINACRPWVEAELAVIKPQTLVCLGATAARALLGADFRLMQQHGRWVESRWAPRTMATLHPSAVLRGEDEAAQARLYGMLVDDLRLRRERVSIVLPANDCGEGCDRITVSSAWPRHPRTASERRGLSR